MTEPLTDPTHVLVVDDDDDFREALSEVLGDAGYPVQQAENGEVALARVAEEAPGIVLLDLKMPVTDDIAETVHYGQLAGSVVAIISGQPVNLIETLAERIAAEVLTDRRIRCVSVTVHKPQAPIDAQFDDVSVTISRSNHD